MQRRVTDYLRRKSGSNNVFVVETEAAEAEAAEAARAEAEMDEYLLRRAEQDLQKAQAKIDALKKKIEERQRLVQ
jgi:hypothetical protein